MNRRHFIHLSALSWGLLSSCRRQPVDPNAPLRFGHFPNLSHLQGLVAHQLTRQGKGWFEERLGVDVQWFTYNAGPSVAEAIFARSLDVSYVGPSPVLNAYAKSRGKEMRILAGATTGGSALVVNPQSNISKPEDFRGKVLANKVLKSRLPEVMSPSCPLKIQISSLCLRGEMPMRCGRLSRG
jgi:NitT/TauT family transport system substrate-binding protein